MLSSIVLCCTRLRTRLPVVFAMAVSFAVEQYGRFINTAPDWFVLELATRLSSRQADGTASIVYNADPGVIAVGKQYLLQVVGTDDAHVASFLAQAKAKLTELYRHQSRWMSDKHASVKAGDVFAKMMAHASKPR